MEETLDFISIPLKPPDIVTVLLYKSEKNEFLHNDLRY